MGVRIVTEDQSPILARKDVVYLQRPTLLCPVKMVVSGCGARRGVGTVTFRVIVLAEVCRDRRHSSAAAENT